MVAPRTTTVRIWVAGTLQFAFDEIANTAMEHIGCGYTELTFGAKAYTCPYLFSSYKASAALHS